MKLEYLISLSPLLRKQVIDKLSKRLNRKIDYEDKPGLNSVFFEDLEDIIKKGVKSFKIGDEIVMNSGAGRNYRFTKQGSKGKVVSVDGDDLVVDFYYQTGKNPPEEKDRWDVSKRYAIRQVVYDFIGESSNYDLFAEKILEKIIREDIELSLEGFSFFIKKIIDYNGVALIRDSMILTKIQENSYFDEILIPQGSRKFLRSYGCVIVDFDYNSKTYFLEGENIEEFLRENKFDSLSYELLEAQAYTTQKIAEFKLIQEAKVIGANYVFIKNQTWIPSSSMNSLMLILEGTPLRILGDTEFNGLIKIAMKDDEVFELLPSIFPEELKKTSVRFATFFPEEFIDYFGQIQDPEKKKEIIQELMDSDYNNPKVIEWLNLTEKELIRDVGMS